ncbi:unnamed protein product [Closterium sp. NIES-54]
MFDLASGAATAPPATADSATRSQWLTRDAAARLAIRNHLPLAECAHFGQHKTTQALYAAVVACYSSPATAALGRLLLPYLFPELSAFATVEDLVSHLHTSDARYPATVPAEFLATNQPPMFITLYFIVTRLPNSLRSVSDHFLSLDPTSLTVDLLEQHLLAAETSAVAVGAARGTPRPPFSFTSVPAGQACKKLHTQHRCFSRLDDAWRAEFGDDVELPRWADLLRSRIAIFDLHFDAILSAMYALSVSAEGDYYRNVPPDPGIAAAALGASESGTLPGTAPAQALLRRLALFLSLADPSGGPFVARSSTVLPCPAVPSGSLSGLHFPSFFTNLVSTTALQDAMVTTTTPGGQRVSICTCTRMGRHLATVIRRPGSSLYTLATEPPQVSAPDQVSASGQVAASCSSLPPLLPSPAPLFLPCVEGRQRAAPHSSSFPPMTAPLQTLNMDMWGPSRVCGQGRERYFQIVVDDYTRYTTVFPLRSKGEVVDVLIPLIRTVRLQLRERFGHDLPVLRLHSDRGDEFSSNLLRDFCHGEGEKMKEREWIDYERIESK